MHRTSAETTSAGRGKILRWLAAFLDPNLTLLLGPNPDPKSGPKQRPTRRNENVIQFWTPFWGPNLDLKMGSGLDQKCGQPSDNVAPARRCFASRFATHEHEHEYYVFFLARPKLFLIQSRLLYGYHVFTTFFDPVLGAMVKQFC